MNWSMDGGLIAPPSIFEKGWLELPQTNRLAIGGYHGIAMVGDNLHVLGGFNDETLNRHHRTPLDAVVWEQLPSFGNRDQHTLDVLESKLYMFGGRTSPGSKNRQGDLKNYDDKGGLWADMATGPQSRYGHGSTTHGGKLYIQGGLGGSYLSDFWCYDPATNAWSRLASGPSARSHPTLFGHGDYIYLHGGVRGVTFNGVFWRYHIPTDAWELLPIPAMSGGGRHTANIIGDNAYFFGGVSVRNSNAFWKYSVKDQSWTNLSTETGMPQSRYGHAATVWKGSLIIHGGFTTQYESDLWVYTP